MVEVAEVADFALVEASDRVAATLDALVGVACESSLTSADFFDAEALVENRGL